MPRVKLRSVVCMFRFYLDTYTCLGYTSARVVVSAAFTKLQGIQNVILMLKKVRKKTTASV